MDLRHLVEDLSRKYDLLSSQFLIVQKEATKLRKEATKLRKETTKLRKEVNYWKNRAMASERNRQVQSPNSAGYSDNSDSIEEYPTPTFEPIIIPEIENGETGDNEDMNQNEENVRIVENEDLVLDENNIEIMRVEDAKPSARPRRLKKPIERYQGYNISIKRAKKTSMCN